MRAILGINYRAMSRRLPMLEFMFLFVGMMLFSLLIPSYCAVGATLTDAQLAV